MVKGLTVFLCDQLVILLAVVLLEMLLQTGRVEVYFSAPIFKIKNWLGIPFFYFAIILRLLSHPIDHFKGRVSD